MAREREPTAVLVVNMGGPDSLGAVQPFLTNLFLDRDIIRLPVQPLLARIIARSRARKVRPRYQAIGGRSPLLDLTEAQAAALSKRLQERGWAEEAGFKVYVGMRYWRPFIADAVAQIAKDGYRQLIVLTLFPHYSRATTGSCLRAVSRALHPKSGLEVTYVDRWPTQPRYIEALADSIEKGFDSLGFDRDKVELVFTAHSLPEEFVTQGDPYVDEIKQTLDAVLKQVSHRPSWHLAFQSRSGPVKWLEPATDQIIQELASGGAEALLMCPISFVSDHIETLFEIDIMYRKQAEAGGVKAFGRCPSLNANAKFIEALAELVESAGGGSTKN